MRLLERAGASPVGHEAALSLVGPVMRYVDFVSTHAAHVYAEFQKYALVDDHREQRDLLEHLLAGEMPGNGPLLSAAHAYRLDSDARIIVAIAMSSDRAASSDAVHAASAALARTALPGPRRWWSRARPRSSRSRRSVDADPVKMCDLLEASAQAAPRGGPLDGRGQHGRRRRRRAAARVP